jgi:predicted nucleic acid-binding protein
MIYCDSAYLLKFYLPEMGSNEVRALFNSGDVAASAIAQIEVTSAMHRKWREGLIQKRIFQITLKQFESDSDSGSWSWLPVTNAHLAAVRSVYRSLPSDCFLRAADALHLACARDYGFKIVYSNDKKLLAAAKYFGLRGRNVIKKIASE